MTTYADQAMQQMREEQARIDAQKPTILPPCPEWCRFTEAHPTHGYDSVADLLDDPITYMRFHVSGNDGLCVSQEEFNRDGAVWLGTPHVFFGGRDDDEMTADEVRDLARELLAAADKLDEISS